MRQKQMTRREAAKLELESAEIALDAAQKYQTKCIDAYGSATVQFQRAMMRFCDASEALRRLPSDEP